MRAARGVVACGFACVFKRRGETCGNRSAFGSGLVAGGGQRAKPCATLT
jgi:hypothetical protein